MVNSTLIEFDVSVEEHLKYPILARHKITRVVAMFSSSNVGTIVWQPLDSKPKRLGLNFQTRYGLERSKVFWEILPKGTRIELIQE